MHTSLIIGGSKGIGLEIARTFEKRGDRVIVIARNKNDWDGEFIHADLSDVSSLEKSIVEIRQKKLNFNYVVFSQKNRMNPNNFSTEIQILIQATQYFVKTLIPELMEQGKAIVFLGSPAEKFIDQKQPVEYHMSKAALKQMAKYYAVQFGNYGITFNCVLPSTILKNSNREFYNANSDIVNLLKEITPLQKFGDAQDIANAVSFFCSDNASFITGQTLLVDGGRSLESHELLARRLMSV